mmetsp:Transcript_39869/g.94701  ORF Transcript_39869/g.94701 Transcript_39869/m.94701 type:complete len:229 (-) Transcript_39869:717-1403(-)
MSASDGGGSGIGPPQSDAVGPLGGPGSCEALGSSSVAPSSPRLAAVTGLSSLGSYAEQLMTVPCAALSPQLITVPWATPSAFSAGPTPAPCCLPAVPAAPLRPLCRTSEAVCPRSSSRRSLLVIDRAWAPVPCTASDRASAASFAAAQCTHRQTERSEEPPASPQGTTAAVAGQRGSSGCFPQLCSMSACSDGSPRAIPRRRDSGTSLTLASAAPMAPSPPNSSNAQT